MKKQKDRDKHPQVGFIQNLGLQLRLVLRLMGDERVNILLKFLPFGTLLYLLIPEPLIGPVDDMAVIGLGFYLFVELCPPDVVEEHRKDLWEVIDADWNEEDQNGGAVLDGKFLEEDFQGDEASDPDEGSVFSKR
jgi:hypothetical protein